MDETPHLKIDFIGFGAPKCGTTWVYECLKKHPDICVSIPKEIHYFNEQNIIDWSQPNENHLRPISWYEKSYAHCKKSAIKGEFSTGYLYSKEAPKLIRKLYPNIKLILCLRNPVDRAYSHYWMNKKEHRRIQGSFEDVIADDRVNQIERGLYAKYLRYYLNYFSQDQIVVVLLDDIRDHPVQALKKILDHIGVDSAKAESLIGRPKNVAKESKSVFLTKIISVLYKMLRAMHLNAIILLAHKIGIKKLYMKLNFRVSKNPPMKAETRKYLIDYYKDDIKDLEKLIGRDLSQWGA